MSEAAAAGSCGCSRLHCTTVADKRSISPRRNMVAQLMMSMQLVPSRLALPSTAASNRPQTTICSTERQTACGNCSLSRTCCEFALTGRQGSLYGTRRTLSPCSQLDDSGKQNCECGVDGRQSRPGCRRSAPR